jgi:YHS domain-containing protein
MRRVKVPALTAVVLFAITVGFAAADRGKGGHAYPRRDKLRIAPAQGGARQTTCPVSGVLVDPAVYLDFQGQRIYLCCDKCAAELRRRPEKYFGRIEAEGVTLENIQVACPVSGRTLGEMGETVTTTYKGRTIKLCCTSCIGKLRRHIGKYLSVLPGEQPARRE